MQKIMIERLSVLEKDVLNSIKNDVQEDDKDMTINAVARRNFVSQALLVKLAKKMGFSGYRDLLFFLRHSHAEEGNPQITVTEEALKGVIKNFSVFLQQSFCEYFQESRKTVISVFGPEEVMAAVDFMVRHIIVKGDGYAAYRGNPLPVPSGKTGLALVISDTGESEAALNMVEQAVQYGIRTIAFTSNERSPMAAASDLAVIISAKVQAFPDVNLFVPMTIAAFILLFKNV